MIPLARRSVLAVAAVVDVALHARPAPVSAKSLAARHALKPRHLETILQALVRAGILKGLRGPRGGYELARERRRITVGDIVRAAASSSEPDGPAGAGLIGAVIAPALAEAGAAYLDALDRVSVADLCRRAGPSATVEAEGDFTI